MLSKHSLNQGTNERMSNSLVWVTRSVQGEWEAFAHLWRIPGWRVTTQWTLGCACPGSTEVLVLEHLQRCFRIFIDLDFISLIPGMRRTRSSCSMSVFAVICCDETPTRKTQTAEQHPRFFFFLKIKCIYPCDIPYTPRSSLTLSC